MVMDTPIVEENGKKVFVGVEDPNNPPIFVKNPQVRYCKHCGKESGNDRTECEHCGRVLDDGKMQCPVCKRFFDYLVGEDINGGKMGCESCWKPPKNG